MQAGEPCSSAGPNLLPATHFKGTLKPSTAHCTVTMPI
ncbi:hypothetical protein FOQG_17146 [Fusarium oxysporum f. sp. raphani 54005]|uniref:Uncharacterized protein n=1 Tax=Fusarium oxysporum f. sp. raphani 54005 TaxID=1089458 RepID=X0BH71_FUSOX|nr:hypothetical protein FOQG_17146 [Fusarium oxysporum f. sp. raphani 54005]